MSDKKFVFIVGSPRSGTTLLGEILHNHQMISQWYEPYFVWDKYFRNSAHDERTIADASDKVCKKIYKDFLRYSRKEKCSIVVDKSPRNSFKIPFIQKIFPNAKFIHILRDGRDVTLSIHKEWLRRKKIIESSDHNHQFDNKKAVIVLKAWLDRQKYYSDKIRALWFETHGHLINKSKHLNRLRWNGHAGWGPRFKNWQECFHTHSILQFNSMQWLKSVQAIYNNWPDLLQKNKVEVKYEDLILNHEPTLEKVLNLLEVEFTEEFLRKIPKFKKDNFHKWKNEFTQQEIEMIKPILAHMIEELGYSKSNEW